MLATDSVRTLLDLKASTASCLVHRASCTGGGGDLADSMLCCPVKAARKAVAYDISRCGGSKRRRRLPIAGRGRAVLGRTAHIRTWWYSEVQEECVLTRCRSRHYISGIGSLVQARKGPQPMPGASTTAAGVRSTHLL